ncbi:kinase-like domain-containing protein [Entophlyctis helioformis]|nr:kinase-like domain-containing protein [Entophlyctis helioformis]
MASLAPCEYKTGRTLGQGSYATVKEAVKIKTGERYAVKMISKKLMAGKEHMILNEIEVLKKVSKGHKNIVTLWDYFETPNNLYFVMDLCTGGELFDSICDKGSFYEVDAANIIRTVVDAVAYLHEQNIVHRDIKPENLLFRTKEDRSEVMIADFGLSKITDSDKIDALRTTCGTPGYMAPEILRKSGHGKPVDMWCIGVMTFFLLCGYMPFDYMTKSSAEEMENILAARYSFDPEYWSEISDQAKDLIRHLLIVDPTKRLTARQALEHPWLKAVEKGSGGSHDLFPQLRKGFDGRRMFRKAIDVVKAVNKLSHSPSASRTQLNVPGHSPGSPQSTSSSNLNLNVSMNQTADGFLAAPMAGGAASGASSQWSINDIRPKEDALVDGNLMVIVNPNAPMGN